MFKNLHELIKQMPDEATCRAYLASQRWADGVVVCPYCEGRGAYVIEGGKRYKCKSATCYKKFSVITGTVFEASNIPVGKWLHAVYVVSAHKKGISSYQLAKDIGISQKSAWFMIHRIREVLQEKAPEMLKGTVEVDETYMSRKYASDYVGLSPEQAKEHMKKHHFKSKGVVFGMAERDGKVRIIAKPEIKKDVALQVIKDNIQVGSTVYTDESVLYKKSLKKDYNHDSVTHWVRQWVKAGDIHVNHVENFWSVMKRGVHGIYHQISYKHLQAYCNEFSYRYNTRKITDKQRFELTLQQVTGRLTYKQLVHGKSSETNQKA
ncbi:MAG TPA: IS1595 family transposase [Chitinophagaceae bacterium]|nr:IS1595 family transposase [Chitinophagaceae bacterium]